MEHLKEAFRRLDPALPLDGSLLQEYYVGRPGDPVGRLAQILALFETPQHILIVGQRGVGKTTELYRLARSLAPDRLAVIHNLDHESISDPSWATWRLAEELVNRAHERGIPIRGLELAPTGTRVEIGWFTAAVDQLRASGFRPAFLVDGLEKRQGRGVESVARVITQLRQIECSIVLVVPISMVLLPEHGAEITEWDRIITLPAISLRHRDGSTDVAGLNLLMTVIDRRDPAQVFVPEARERLVQLSAGIHRTLLTLAQDACLNAMTRGAFSVDRVAVEEAAAERGLEMNGFLTPRFLDMLDRVRHTKLIRNFADALPLLERNSIIAYQNSSPWYDVNPLVSPSLAAFGERSTGSS
jgi:hypothetical protein